jgi:hypothetical protein
MHSPSVIVQTLSAKNISWHFCKGNVSMASMARQGENLLAKQAQLRETVQAMLGSILENAAITWRYWLGVLGKPSWQSGLCLGYSAPLGAYCDDLGYPTACLGWDVTLC